MRPDARLYQISCLSLLLFLGLTRLHFDIGPTQIALSLGAALLTQWACQRLWKAGPFEPKSALISGLSLCLLLRSDHVWVAPLAAVVAVGAKFALRVNGKHLFNPTNLGVVVAVLFTGHAWISPGQWGNVAFFAFLFACLGGVVVNRAERADITWAFLIFWTIGVVYRSWFLHEPMRIPVHRLESGSLLLFTFFMISDPKTTPDSRVGRVIFAAIVAAVGWYLVFKTFRPTGVIFALALCSPLVPLLDRLLPARRHQWTSQSTTVRSAA